MFLLSGFVYKCHCGGCSATYFGKNKRDFKIRICEHLGFLPLTGKRAKGDYSTIKQNILFCNHLFDFEDFSIHITNSKNFKVTLIWNLPINREQEQVVLTFGTSW